uniref:uncharacterized protein isoform X2 n=1 Tax=Semicossyphus pulcher TaxID=241346 RepID=UPI0037E8DFAD
MIQFRWFKMTFFLLLLQITATTGEFHSLNRDGDDVTLPPGNVTDDKTRCDRTNWVFRRSTELVKDGQILKSSEDRLSLTADCSLLIKKVTVEDAGIYNCQQSYSGQQDTLVYLSVVNMIEQKDGEWVILSCSVSAADRCEYTVKWLYEGEQEDIETFPAECSLTVRFRTSLFNQSSKYLDLFKCEVTDGYTHKKHLFDFSPQSSDEKPGEDATKPSTTPPIRTTESSKTTGTDSKRPAINVPGWWLYVIAAIGSVVLLIVVVMVIRWKRTEGDKRKMADSTGLSFSPAVALQSAPETSLDTADPEDGVSYASVTYKKSCRNAQVKKEEDEGDEVTYSTVKASSSSAGASTDPCTIYAAVNKPNKKEASVI